jgi:cysteinyl-tRNA synthetase
MGESLAGQADQTLRRLGQVLGIDFQATHRGESRKPGPTDLALEGYPPSISVSKMISDDEVARLVDARNAARSRRDWATADAIRKQLANAGVTIEDRPDGTTRIKR